MTPSHASAGWRAQRPFWGGLFLLLSGLELFVSGNLKLALEVHFGPTGFLSYVIPLIMLLCGGLTWFSPQQRLFYGILGTVTALYSLIGLNLGGFFLGTVLGLVGGGLAVAWSPAPTPAPSDDDSSSDSSAPASDAPMYYEDAPLDDMLGDETREVPAPAAWSRSGDSFADDTREVPAPAAWPPPSDGYDRPPSGVLRDEIPTTNVSPLHDRHEGSGAGSADEQLPPSSGPGDLPKRRYLGPLLMAIALTAALVGAANRGGSAFAAPAACPTSSAAKPAGSAPATTGAPAQTESAAPTPTPTPTPTEEKQGLLGWLGDLFTGGDDKNEGATAEASAVPTTSAPAPPPATTTPGTKPSTAKPSSTPACGLTSASPSPNNKKAQVAAGQPFVAAKPSILKADVMTMDGLTYDGVADLPRKDGTTVKVLAFTMKNSVSTPFELDTPGGPKLLITKSSKLTVEGDVKFYTTSFSANVLGLLPLTFTPSFPPPPIPLPGFYTACTIELVFVQSNVLTAPDMDIAYAN
ncbi:DUF6114 domain-containing protein [Dactylosporangium sp. NPDC049140]|uniref:DUF6114 domain-containing protein n=1 Tax=Dactylosporangium sp. NPDC049140 TaxID=3155647 RepID=UPI0033E23A23